MSVLLDCSTCGGLLPAGRSCCPHCHCKSSAWKRWAVVASAAVALGAADCNGPALSPGGDMSTKTNPDLSMPEPVVEYGPAIQHDMADVDGGS
jgi:hypothetical protein